LKGASHKTSDHLNGVLLFQRISFITKPCRVRYPRCCPNNTQEHMFFVCILICAIDGNIRRVTLCRS